DRARVMPGFGCIIGGMHSPTGWRCEGLGGEGTGVGVIVVHGGVLTVRGRTSLVASFVEAVGGRNAISLLRGAGAGIPGDAGIVSRGLYSDFVPGTWFRVLYPGQRPSCESRIQTRSLDVE